MENPPPRPVTAPLCRRLGWFILIWALGVGAMTIFAYGFRHLMSLAGLTV